MDRVDRLLKRVRDNDFLLIVKFTDGTYKISEAGTGKLVFTKTANRETPCTLEREAGAYKDVSFSDLFNMIMFPREQWQEVKDTPYPLDVV